MECMKINWTVCISETNTDKIRQSKINDCDKQQMNAHNVGKCWYFFVFKASKFTIMIVWIQILIYLCSIFLFSKLILATWFF